MRKSFFAFILSAILFTACQPVVTTPTLTPTLMLLPPAQIPGTAPSLEPFNLLPVTEKIPSHPLALDESNVATEMKRLRIYGTGELQDIEFSPDGKYLAAATSRGIYLYDGTTFEPTSFIDVNNSVSAIAFSPDEPLLAAAANGKVSLWNVLSGQKLLELNGGAVRLWTLAYGKGGYVAALGTNCSGCGSPQQVMILWEAKTGRQIYFKDDIWYWTKSLAFTTDGKKLAYGDGAGLEIIVSETGEVLSSYSTTGGLISEAVDVPFDLIFSKDENHLFVTSMENDGQVLELLTQKKQKFPICWAYLFRTDNMGVCPTPEQIVFFDLSNGQKISSQNLPGFDAANDMFTINPEGDFFAYGTPSILHIINSQTSAEIKTLFFDTFNNVQTGIILLDGEKKSVVAVQTGPGQVALLDLETSNNLRTFKLESGKIKGFAFRPDNKIAAIVNEENSLFLLDVQTEQIVYTAILPEAVFGSFMFTPDGLSVLFTTDPDPNVLEFNLQTREGINHEKNGFRYFPLDSDNYRFNELGNLVMLHYQNNSPVFQDVKTGQSVVIPLHLVSDSDFIEAFALNRDGKFLALGNPNDIFVWELETQKQIFTLHGHEFRGADGGMGKIRSLAFNPQSDLLVSVGWDETTRLWDIYTGRELRRLNVCCRASFTPDGRFLITAGNGVLRVWGIP
jgi:WD40 repeat protein